MSRAGQAILDRLEALPVPVVAAIHGTCVGGGTETVLACRYRIASDDPKTALGLPEVQLGLIAGRGRHAAPAAAHRPAPRAST